jgi:hypothetical protein
MNAVRIVVFVSIVAFGVMSPGSRTVAAQQPTGQLAAGMTLEALAQIEALIAEKDGRTAVQQKIDSQLLYERSMESGQALGGGLWIVETDLPYAADGHVVIDVHARAGSGLAARLPATGVEVVWVSDDGSSLRAHINIDDVEALAADPDVLFVQPRQDAMVSGQSVPNLATPTGQGSRSSEGDVTHLAFAARGAFHIDGAGLKIGVLSDGVRNLAASQAAGDLGAVTVIGPPAPCPAGNLCDEGTAMLEIIHDVAPGAELFFASANVSITSFAANIRALRDAGCDIIVDDVFYFVETPFQDGAPGPTPTNGGAVIQAVKDVTATGVMYFSSAGNSGNLDAGTAGAWEGDFVDGGATGTPLGAGRVHDFGGQNFNLLTVANTAGAPISLYWSDPLGASSNDYDLFRLNATGTIVVAASTNTQNGTQDPIEQIGQGTVSPPTSPRIVIVKKAAAEPRFLHLNTNRGRLSMATAGTTHGHATANSVGAFTVAATPASGPFPQPFSGANHVETFSSDGPRHIFYNGDGTPITPGNVLASGGQILQKPDITAADGVSVTGAGNFPSPFVGTSAAAPHAAAIAALVKAASSALTPEQIRTILTSTAIDIERPGFDRDSGAGIVMARDALVATGATGTAFLAVESVDSSDNPGNSNGVLEAGEGGRMTIALKNYGVVPASNIVTSLTSPTTGITVGLPNTQHYPDLAPLASASGVPLLFTAASDFGCPGQAGFTLTASYTGGIGPLTQVIVLPVGVSSFTITKNLDGTTPPLSPGVVATTGVQNFRLNRQDNPSVCGALKPPPPISLAGGAGARRFDAYTFTTCGNSVPSCAAVTFGGPNSLAMFTAAYVPTFNPDNITQNYRADPAVSSDLPLTYSFDLPAGSSTFAVDVHDLPVLPAPSGSSYTLSVTGACVGTCLPPNHPPVARATSVAVAANEMCIADASIDDASSDADGDPITAVQSPAGPYGLGTTAVRLTATDPSGAFSQANGSVTVVDRTAPTTSDVSAEWIKLEPRLRNMFAYRIDYTTSDNCGQVTTSLSVTFSDSKRDNNHEHDRDWNGHRDGGAYDADDDMPDFVIVDNHHVWLRADEGHGARIYMITVTAVDGAGNTSSGKVIVDPPRDWD